MAEDWNYKNLYIPCNLKKIKNKQNKLHHFLFKRLFYSTLQALAKGCGKLISRKLVLGNPTQLKARYLYKANESQSA